MVTIITLTLLVLMAFGNETATFIFFALIIVFNVLKIRQGFLLRKSDSIECYKSIILNGGIILFSVIYLIAALT